MTGLKKVGKKIPPMIKNIMGGIFLEIYRIYV